MAEQHQADQRDAALSAPLTTIKRFISYNLIDAIKSFIHNAFSRLDNKEMKNVKPIKTLKNGLTPHPEPDLRPEDFKPLLASLDRVEAKLTQTDDALHDASETIERLLVYAASEQEKPADEPSH